ncbi:MAG: hypothetical protein RIQ81_1443 [Pseudomonadota bacterium]
MTRHNVWSIVWVISIATLSLPAYAANRKTTVQVEHLTPGQSSIGKAEAIIRANAIESMTPDEQQEYLREHQLEVVTGPGQKLHLVDGHHLAWALLELKKRGVMDAAAPAKVLGDYSQSTAPQFEKVLIRRNWVWLFDETDQPITVRQLPAQIAQLKDAPHRTLAWLLREEGCYDKSQTPFSDFAWASWLRQRIKLHTNHPADIARAVLEAKAIAHEKSAERLPGYLATHKQADHSSLTKKTKKRLASLENTPVP